MPGKKRVSDDQSTPRTRKKSKLDDGSSHDQSLVSNTLSEVDFPRGGGTSFTPLEVKAIRAEGVKEANESLFEELQAEKQTKKKRRPSDVKVTTQGKNEHVRIEQLNYKRISVEMKIMGQIVAVQPLALVVSLPNQLFAHVPITQISSQFTTRLETAENADDTDQSDKDEDEDEEMTFESRVPDLFEIFRPGQYVRAVVTAVHMPGSTGMSGLGKTRDEVSKASRRVELSLDPAKVNAGVHKADLHAGFTLSAAIKSVEDHGYILDLGIPDVSGFLSFKDAKKGPFEKKAKLHVGQLLDVSVKTVSSNRRTCNVVVDADTFSSSSLSEVTNVTSVLPGALVQSLITAVHDNGLNLQVLGYFDGTVDQFHLRHGISYKVGKKLKARVLYDFSSTPPKFALSLADHVVALGVRQVQDRSMEEAYPIGTILKNVAVSRTEPERGLIVEVGVQPRLEGFVHISQLSEDHVPSLSPSSGPWKIGSTHTARVTGYFHFDGLLQLSLKQSVLEQKYLQVEDVQVGELIKGTIKKLADSGLFVTISGTIDGVVWPNHYADITLKNPSKRFKVGGSIKCRVLVVDPERKRISLTAKKTLLESTLPILSRFEDATVGLIVHAVIFKIFAKNLLVEFYNGITATIPARETSETITDNLSESFAVGKVVKVRIISVDTEPPKLVASIRQASANFKPPVNDISGVEIGNIVEGVVSEIHKENALLTLQPTQVRALISFKNMANHHATSAAQLRASLKEGAKIEELIVVSRNPEKGFVIVSYRPKAKVSLPAKGSLSTSTVMIGQMVGGRVIRHTRNGVYVKLTTRIGGILHPTDASDDYDTGTPFPPIDNVLKATVIGIDATKDQLALSTRHSRMYPDQNKPVTDRVINGVADLQTGQIVRGFIKNVAEHGLFVTLGREVDARVQIKELFDEYVKEWKGRFRVNQLVKGRILSVDTETKKVEMSFRSGDITKKPSSSLTLADLREGQIVDGKVKKIEDYGLFLEISGTKLSGLCHKSQLSDNQDADVSVALRCFREGDSVRAKILSVDIEKRRISFGLKPSYLADDEEKEESDADGPASEDLGAVNGAELSSENGDASASDVDNDSPAPGEDDDDDIESIRLELNKQSPLPNERTNADKAASAPTPLKLRGFQWSGTTQSDEEMEQDSSSDEDTGQSKKKKKRRKKEIEQDLTADMHTKTPESNADFERLLLGSPNSSYLWIQYMSFQLQLSEVEKAREVARRALRTINFREEQEKLNVWIAMLNLENAYGTDDSLEATFKDAVRHNDSKTVHLRLALIFDQAEKHEKAEEQYKRTSKKFGQSSKVWTLFGEHYFKRGELEQARNLLPRSLQSLEKRKHLKTISKFAQLEYKIGDPERGKTIFEGIADSHPKRWDLWSIYIDMEAGQGDIQSIRNIFDRVLALKMTSHKAKSFFKKWLALEKRLGDEQGAATVKEKAVEWTQRAVDP